MLSTPQELLARPVTWMNAFAAEALEILSGAFMGEFTAQELADHIRWPQMEMLLANLHLADYTDRSLDELHEAGVVTDAEVAAIVEASHTATPLNPDRLTQRVFARGRLDSAERLLENLGDADWYARAEATIEAWRDLAVPAPALFPISFAGEKDYWVRSWRGSFTVPDGPKFSVLNIVESDAIGTTSFDEPVEAAHDITRISRSLRKIQGGDSLTLYVDRGFGIDWELEPTEQWAQASAKSADVNVLNLHGIYGILSTAEFDNAPGE